MINDQLIGTQLGSYQIEALIGHGGMARIYRGYDRRSDRPVAVKVIDTPYQRSPAHLERFEREAMAVEQLHHRSIVRSYEHGEAQGLIFLAMEYIEGQHLQQILADHRESGTMVPLTQVLRVAEEIGAALDHAHAHGVIHRDIKPSNIICATDGRVVLVDFGLALVTSVGTIGTAFGTPHYMAPEQAISSASAVPQSDLYALGVVLYEMLTGSLPFEAEDPLEVALLHLSEQPPCPRELRPELPEAAEELLLRTLSKTPEERPDRGSALAYALSEALAPLLSATTDTLGGNTFP